MPKILEGEIVPLETKDVALCEEILFSIPRQKISISVDDLIDQRNLDSLKVDISASHRIEQRMSPMIISVKWSSKYPHKNATGTLVLRFDFILQGRAGGIPDFMRPSYVLLEVSLDNLKIVEEESSPPPPTGRWVNHYPGGGRIFIWLNPQSVEEVEALQDEIFTSDPGSESTYLMIFITERSAIPFAMAWQHSADERLRKADFKEDNEVLFLKYSHTCRPWSLAEFSEEDANKFIEALVRRQAIDVGFTDPVPPPTNLLVRE
jgi:hypothetical protein